MEVDKLVASALALCSFWGADFGLAKGGALDGGAGGDSARSSGGTDPGAGG